MDAQALTQGAEGRTPVGVGQTQYCGKQGVQPGVRSGAGLVVAGTAFSEATAPAVQVAPKKEGTGMAELTMGQG